MKHVYLLHIFKEMSRNNIYLILTLFFITSCNRSSVKPVTERIELIRLGSPEYIDTTDVSKIGGIIYATYETNQDSVFIKSCMDPRFVYDGVYPADGLKATYFKTSLTDTLKKNLTLFINYLDTLKDGRLPGNYRDPETIGCNLMGTWLAVFTSKKGIKHYYNFSFHHLPKPIEETCRAIYLLSLPNQTRLTLNRVHIDTDSMTQAILRLPSMRDIELAPKIKSTLKFTPPEIEPQASY